MTDNKIPQNVIEALAEARATGAVNMFSRSGVIEIVDMIDEDAGAWLDENKSCYMDALNAMGEYISKPKAAPVITCQRCESPVERDGDTCAECQASIDIDTQWRAERDAASKEAIAKRLAMPNPALADDDNTPLATSPDDLLADMSMVRKHHAHNNNPATIAAGFETVHRHPELVVRANGETPRVNCLACGLPLFGGDVDFCEVCKPHEPMPDINSLPVQLEEAQNEIETLQAELEAARDQVDTLQKMIAATKQHLVKSIAEWRNDEELSHQRYYKEQRWGDNAALEKYASDEYYARLTASALSQILDTLKGDSNDR